MLLRWARQLIAALGLVTTDDLHSHIAKLEKIMADVSPLLTQLATDLRAYASGPLAALIARNVELEARNAELEGEDASESSAAQDAVTAFNEMVAPVTEAPEVPIEIPPVEVPETPQA